MSFIAENFLVGLELNFMLDILLALGTGVAIGAGRESGGKPAGIITNCLVI